MTTLLTLFRKAVLVYGIIVLTASLIGAQVPSETPFSEPIQNIPPSPTSAAFAQYGNFPVSLHTGTPNISIPIYEIKGRKLSVPITLTYHASGIKVDQRPSWVGLGWNLNFGGVVTRQMRGVPDEYNVEYKGFFNSYDDFIETVDYSDPDHITILQSFIEGFRDGLPDIFTYNLMGETANFIYDGNRTPYTIPHNQVKISGGIADNTPYEIVGEDGTIYQFNAKETTRTIVGQAPNPAIYISSWYLTRMVSADRSDTIDFKYKEHNIPLYSLSNPETISVSHEYGTEYSRQEPIHYGFENFTQGFSSNINIENAQKIQSIEFTGGRVEFKISPMGDDRKLDEIIIYSKDNITGEYEVIRKFIFKTSYFNGTRLRLDKIYEVGMDEAQPPYEFSYFDSPLFPVEYTSFNKDRYGYFNGSNNDAIGPDGTGIEPETIVRYYNSTGQGANFNYGGADRDIDENHVKALTLRKVKYPSGGFTEMDFESNRYGNPEELIGGIRIKSQISTDPLTGNTIHKTYEYIEPELLGPTYTNKKTFPVYQGVYLDCAFLDCDQGCYTYDYLATTISSEPFSRTLGSSVGYRKVRETFGQQNDNNGSILHEFVQTPDSGSPYYPFPPLTDQTWRRGHLLSKTVYNNTGNIIKETKNTYQLKPINKKVEGFFVAWQTQVMGCYLPSAAFWNGKFFISEPYNDSQFFYLSNSESSDYSSEYNGNKVTRYTDYYYDKYPAHNQLTSSEVSTSTLNKKVLTEIHYPQDKDEIVGLSTEEGQALDLMISQNRIAEPVESQIHVDGVKIDHQRTNFEVSSNVVRIKDQEWAVNSNPLVSERSYIFNEYTNPIETFKSSDISQSIIWGYEQKLPIAFVMNASNNKIAYTSFEDVDLGNWKRDPEYQIIPINVNINEGEPSFSFKTKDSQNITFSYTMSKTFGPSPELTFIEDDGSVVKDYLQQPSGSGSVTLPGGDWSVQIIDVGPDGGNVISANVQFAVNTVSYYPTNYSTESHTGKYSLEMGSTNELYKSNIPIGKYVVSYWDMTGTFTLLLTGATELSSKSLPANGLGWRFTRKEIEVTSSSNKIAITGTGKLDEARLYPKNSQMTSFTYYQNSVMSSRTEPNDITTYFTFDGKNRLEKQIDFKNNTLQQYQYHLPVTLETPTLNYYIDSQGGDEIISIHSNISWELVPPASVFYTLSDSSGSGNKEVTLTVNPNTTQSTRTSNVTLKNTDGSISYTINITQYPN